LNLHKTMSNVQIRCLGFTSLGHFINDGTVFFVPLIADIFANQGGVTPLELTLMFVIFYGSASILSAYVGRLADVTGGAGSLIAVGTTLLSLSMFTYYMTLSYATGTLFLGLMMGSAFIAGFGSAFYHPLGASLLQASFVDTQRGRALGLNGAFGSIGRALYPSMFFFVAIFLSTYGSLAFFGAVGMLASLGILLGLRSERVQQVSGLAPAKESTRARDAMTSGIIILTLISFVRSAATSGITSWIPIFISTQKGLGVTGALGLTLTVMFSTAIVGQPFFGWLLDRYDRRIILAVSSAGSGLTIIAYLFTHGLAELLILAVFGLFTFTAFPLFLSLASNYEPEGSSSLGNALVWGLGTSGGSVIGPLITGALVLTNYQRLGFAFEIMAMGILISAAGTLFLPRAKTRKPSKSPVPD
jgi:FSR family fosmidomycin resistance protein-like MFS transporter